MKDLLEKKGNAIVKVRKISTEQDLQKALQIRYEVFVTGQNVPVDEEIDEFEKESFHYLALLHDVACGAARWRYTSEGAKLERFAVLEKYRGSGAGSALVKKVLEDIQINPDSRGKALYLHAQLPAIKLYRKFGFKQVGELFLECEIQHYKMVK
jgi:predicted GNAT family N-acyltransferase